MTAKGKESGVDAPIWQAAQDYLASERADRAEADTLATAVQRALSSAGRGSGIYVAKLTNQGYSNQFWQGKGLSQPHDLMVACDQSGNIEGVCSAAKSRLHPRPDSGFEAVVIARPQGEKWVPAAVVQVAHSGIGNSLRQALANPNLPVLNVADRVNGDVATTTIVEESTQQDFTISLLQQHLAECPNVVLEGPPGTGKTFLAQELLRHYGGTDWQSLQLDCFATTPGCFDDDRIAAAPLVWDMVQFHPSYAYEDFVEGLRTNNDGNGFSFVIRRGVLPTMARAAALRHNRPTILVIDEINRGNVGAALGETLFAIDPAHRGRSVRVQYAGHPGSIESLSIPQGLWIIGTMNTADRSLALLDFALRRRFRFLPIGPSEGAVRRFYGDSAARTTVAVEVLRRISLSSLDRDLCPGHAYVMVHRHEALSDADWAAALAAKVFNEVRPLFREYDEEGLLPGAVLLPGKPEEFDLLRENTTDGREALILWIRHALKSP